MVSASPWSVKGIEPEAREAAKIAARRAGMTVGQWLSRTIRATAAQQLAGAPPLSTEPAPTQPDSLPSSPAAMAVLGPQNGLSAETLPIIEAGHTAHPPMRLNEAIFENILRLANRIEESESKTQAAVAPLVDQVEQLSEQVEQVKARATLSTAPVERAVTRLSERLEKIEAARQAETDGRRWSLFSNNG